MKIDWDKTNEWPFWAKAIGVILCAVIGLFFILTQNPELLSEFIK